LILPRAPLNQYVIGLAKALYTRGFEVEGPVAEFDDSGYIVFSIVGRVSEPGAGDVSMNLDEAWRPLSARRWERDEYTYDLIDEPRARRRAFHLHDRALAEAALRTHAHEHCEEILGRAECRHYLGREVPDGYAAVDLLMAAWLEPGPLGCSALLCLDSERRRPGIPDLDPDLDLDELNQMRSHRFKTRE
jgi:hypothetical protein